MLNWGEQSEARNPKSVFKVQPAPSEYWKHSEHFEKDAKSVNHCMENLHRMKHGLYWSSDMPRGSESIELSSNHVAAERLEKIGCRNHGKQLSEPNLPRLLPGMGRSGNGSH